MNTYDGMEFSRKLKILAGQHRYSQSMLARELEVSQNLVSLWTRGASIPDLYEAAKIAKLFGVDVNFLADDSLDEPPKSGLTEDERALVSVFRAKGIDFEEAVRRLDTKPHVVYGPPPGQEHGTGRSLGSRDLTEARLRRLQEEREPKPVEKPKGEAKGKGVGRNGSEGQKGTEGKR